MSSHTALAITSNGILEVLELPTPKPGPGEVLVQMHYASLIAFDTYQLDRGYFLTESSYPHVLGFSGSGIVEAVGENITDLKKGDRVASMNFPATKSKAAQKYAVVPRTTVAKIPDSVPLLQAASFPDNYVTAMFTLFGASNLAIPFSPSFPEHSVSQDVDAPVLIYGAGASSGQYMIQLLKLAGFKNILATASPRNHVLLKELGATHCFDYRSPDLVQNILAATGGRKFAYVADTIGVRASLSIAAAVSDEKTRIAVLLPIKDGESVANGTESAMHSEVPNWAQDILSGLNVFLVATFKYQEDPIAREIYMPKILPNLLEKGLIKPNNIRLLNKGSLKERVEEGLDLLRNNKVSGEKVVVELDF